MSLSGGSGGFPLHHDRHPFTGPAIGTHHLSGLGGGAGGYPFYLGGHWSMITPIREIAPREHHAYGAQLGCCDDLYGHLGQLEALGTCPGGPVVVVEDNPIPLWVLLAVGIWGVLMLLKKR